MIELPLQNYPAHRYTTTINNANYEIMINYNHRSSNWFLTLMSNNVVLTAGVALVTGVNLVQHLNLPFDNLWLINLDGKTDPAEELLSNFKLVILDDGDL